MNADERRLANVGIGTDAREWVMQADRKPRTELDKITEKIIGRAIENGTSSFGW